MASAITGPAFLFWRTDPCKPYRIIEDNQMATENLFKKLKQENQFRILFHPLLVMLGIFTASVAFV